MSLRVGNQRPRIELVPDSVYSAGQEVIEFAQACGVRMDEWQRHVLIGALGVQENGKWAASQVGVVLTRQSGKSVILEARMLAGAFLFGERLQLFSSQDFKTTSEIFRRILNTIDDTPALKARVLKVTTATGNEGIELVNGSRIRFLARSSGSGRGMSPSTIYLDEAYSLQQKEIAALLPGLSANTVEGNPQVWFASSAGMPQSEVLAQVRERGKNPRSERLAYFEWSAPDDARADDVEAWYQANPALGMRISEDHVRTEFETLGDEEFRRERLGIWAKLGGESAIPAGVWADAQDDLADPGSVLAFAVDVPPGRESATICSAAFLPDGKVHFEVVDRREGTSWVSTRLAELRERWKPVAVVVDAGSAAGALLPDFKRDRVRTTQISLREYSQACGSFYDLVMSGRASHVGEPVLDAAVAAARQKALGDTAWYWSRRNAASDISPLVACTNALHGLQAKGRQGKRRTGSRVLIL